MFDTCVETFRAIIVALIVIFLLANRKRSILSKTKGWKFILAGFILILFGTCEDITDNFSSLNHFIVIGHTEIEAFIEKIVGYLFGFLSLAYGIWLWIPEISKLDRLKETEKLQAETDRAISDLLKLSLSKYNIKDQLVRVLKILTKISWFEVLPQGAVFLSNPKNELIMVASYHLAPPLLEKCAKIKIGECLCGLAAQEREIIFRNCVTEEHTIAFSNMQPHGHYNIPLIHNDTLLGVIVLYVPQGHIPHEKEYDFMKMLGDTVANIVAKKTLEEKIAINNAEAEELRTETIGRLLSAAEFRDTETGDHIKRMTEYALVLGKEIGLAEKELELLRLGAPMHDIGKVGIPDAILLKPGKLSTQEFTEMKRHTTIGAELLKGREETFCAAHDIALTHHERWDGAGYPEGLKEGNIPLFGRICAVADVFDALTSDRPYKKSWAPERAFAFIQKQRGAQFDPQISEAMLHCKGTIMDIYTMYRNGAQNGSTDHQYETSPAGPQGWLSWDNTTSTGIHHIDNQHKYLVSITNELYNAVETSDDGMIVFSVTKKLLEYARVHFASEEQAMLDCNYPELAAHREYHDDFINRIDSFRQSIKKYPLVASRDLLIFLRDWFCEHINNEDAKIYDYVRITDEPSRNA